MSTHTNDSNDFIRKLKDLGNIEDNEYLFASNAVAMCLNIDTEEVIAALTLACETDLMQFGENFLMKQLIRALRIQMKHNIFRFRSACYLHQDRIAIG